MVAGNIKNQGLTPFEVPGLQINNHGDAEQQGNHRYVKVVKDWLGNTVKEVRSSGADGTNTETKSLFEFGDNGLLLSTQKDDYAKQHFEYDEFAQLELSGLDLDAETGLNSKVDEQGQWVSSDDRINKTENEYEIVNSEWWRVTRNYTFGDEDTDDPQLVSESRSQITGLGTSHDEGTLTAVEEIEDRKGRVTTTKTWVDYSDAKVTKKSWSSRYSAPSVSVYVNGKFVSATTPSGVETSYEYDGHGRLYKMIDDRIGSGYPTHYEYITKTSLLHKVKQPHAETGDPITVQELAYDASGRVKSENNANGKFTYYGYNSRSERTHIWGDVPYPVKMVYDNYGQLEFQYTYRTAEPTNGWTDGALDLDTGWPDDSSGDRTEYVYFVRSGLLKEVNRFDGSPEVEYTTAYDYYIDGKLKSRTWERGTVTDYDYDADTGELETVTYDDGITPSIDYTYDRRGAIETVDQDGIGVFTYSYHNDDFKVDEFSLPSYFGTNQVVKYAYDALDFFKGYQFGPSSNPNSFHTYYNLDPVNGRLDNIVSTAGTFDLGYATNSDLIETRTVALGGTGDFEVETIYKARRNVFGGVSISSNTTGLANYGFAYDNLTRRTVMNNSGTVFSKYDPGYGIQTSYTYSDRNELTDAVTANETANVPGRDFNYRYDHIGNRLFALVDEEPPADPFSETPDYESNGLNQYEERDTGDQFFVSGFANTGATVGLTLNSTSAGNANSLSNSDLFFSKWLDKSAPTTATLEDVDFIATISSPFAVAEKSNDVRARMELEDFDYDDDGNLTVDSLWTYEYDGENRLIEMESELPIGDGLYVILEFAYDYMGRRIEKRVKHHSGGTPTVSSITRFVWAGWQMLAELDVDPGTSAKSLMKTYTWGPDLSGSVGGAGHVGGLLSIEDHTGSSTETYFAGFDGNGNVSVLVDEADGSLAAVYEYDPFGGLLRASGYYALENPFRFSTKYLDDESGLSYYGYRYYHSDMGRFVNRDPIEERGGWALYGGLNFATTNPFFLGSNLQGRGWYDEWKEKQDSLLRNTSLSHSTEEIQLGGYRNSTLASTFEKDKKFYSANAMAHDSNQGGSNGLELDEAPAVGGGMVGGNRDVNLYLFAGNNPINSFDALGLEDESPENQLKENAYLA